MSSDWMKMEVATPDKPEVFEIAGILNLDPEVVFTKLFRVWSWFDQHSENGNAPVTLRALLDSRANVTGFCAAMEKVGWLKIDGQFITLPNFERHVGESAKKRALTSRRAAKHRKSNANSNAESNADSVTNASRNALPRIRDRNIYKTNAEESVEGIARDPLPPAAAKEFDYSNWKPDDTCIARIRATDPDITGSFIETERLDFITFAEDNHIPERLLRSKFQGQVHRHWIAAKGRELNQGPLRTKASVDIRDIPVDDLEAWSLARGGPPPNMGESADLYRIRIIQTLRTSRESDESAFASIERTAAGLRVN